MEFILKDKFIYIVGTAGMANSKVEGALVTKYVANADSKTFTYAINGGQWKRPVNGHITININELKTRYVQLRVKALNNDGVDTYESDKVPFTQAIVFGHKIEDAYPEVIKTLFARLDRVDTNMNSFVDTLEEINKKGDLF